MAKVSMVQRELKREKLVAKYAEKRAQLKETIRNPNSSDEDVEKALADMQKLPRDASPTRQTRRCGQTGRPHGVYRRFDLGRNKLREAAMRGDVPGLRKSSW